MKQISEILDVEKGKKELEQDRITVGVATCGISAGADKTLEKLKTAGLSLLVEGVGCAGSCYAEPIVTVKQNGLLSIYGYVTEDKADKLIESIRNSQVCEEMLLGHKLEDIEFYKKQLRIVMKNCGFINGLSLEQYAANGGFTGLANALKLQPSQLIEEVKRSKLRGRGGAGFLTGMKWGFLAAKQGRKFIVCNGDEGDPGAFMNRTVMESDPFSIIEGMIIASYATGAKEGIIYTRTEYPLAIKTIEKALVMLKDKGLLGKSILGVEGFDFDIILKKGAGAFVCGEETALIASVMGKRGHPRFRPPYPADKGVYDCPTNINNVGTLANISKILAMGVDEYIKIGTEKTKGTKDICLTGKVKRTGIVEVPMGTKLREIIFDAGGGPVEGTNFKAVQIGGPSGGCLTEADLDLPLDYEPLQNAGAIMGSGGMVVINDESCMVNVAKYFTAFTRSESCGKCTPCREGNTRMNEILDRITKGLGTEQDIKKLKLLAEYIRDNSLCNLGKTAPNPVLSTIAKFPEEYDAHIKEKRCPSKVCIELLKYIINEKCTGCGACARVCPTNAITGRIKERHVIEQAKCIKCGNCYDICAFNAIDRK
ncbi:SLBB domain-containing protein [Candidatus Woesearchaeota archaeon]|nr:SLBB domain-containing protein [Candidatus Woesearchaeota archaeon]